MAIDIDAPDWGDAGQRPPDGTQFDGGDRYHAQYADWLWNNFGDLISQVNNEFNGDIDATTYKGNDIDSDGDSIVDEADYAYDGNATQYKGNDIDSDGDGVVDKADDVVRHYRNTDIPKTELKSGDSAIGREVYVPSGYRISFYEAALEPNGSVVPDGLFVNAHNVSDNAYIVYETARHQSLDPADNYQSGPVKVRLRVHNDTDNTVKASGGLVWTLEQE